ncbi:hypothetical protein S7711_05521 [Stachybotrys chartarum IBT 7711]|jgi:hypothetical protein|uniref:Uncharacterized protein n=1 Tax=Stachybotrys chartarum (strain CBS 109288 / IBT 7711) TaxID=1280523 RepID=A0A084AS33_STACB|nr:hypothetical protein S7711_05521 [Stachybotrys chartarum IBT 7711]KFA53463.1 hypothetical protein S40293_03449 [Stachybotrys chartarum IBT 40293]
MPSQRPYFLSSFLAAFRQQGPSLQAGNQQPNKQASTSATAAATASYSQSTAAAASAPRTITANTNSPASSSHPPSHHHATSPAAAVAIHSASARRRGSDSSSEGFRDVLGADKWYIGGRTATGEEQFFKLGVVRRVRSNDRLSLDRLSL